MASNFVGHLRWSISITYGTLADFGSLQPGKLKNGLEIPGLITMVYYINFGGHVPKIVWADLTKTAMGRLRGPIWRVCPLVVFDLNTFCIFSPL
mgnify:FL=1